MDLSDSTPLEVLAEGRFLRLVSRAGWEYVERQAAGVVAMVAVNASGELLLIEQYRPPVGKPVIDIPAGLVGDIPGQEDEAFQKAAGRELLEETGYEAGELSFLAATPTSPGLSSEVVHLYRASNLTRIGSGGGDETENLLVHEVPLPAIESWLQQRAAQGSLIDLKVYAALHFVARV